MKEALVSIVIVNWNGRRFLKDCLESVYHGGFSSFEVIFVDNGSTDGSVEFVRENFPGAVLIENAENLGFAGEGFIRENLHWARIAGEHERLYRGLAP